MWLYVVIRSQESATVSSVFFLWQESTYRDLLAVCPQIIGHVVYWRAPQLHEPVPIACLAQGKVMECRSYTAFSSMEELAAATAVDAGLKTAPHVDLQSLAIALSMNSPTLSDVMLSCTNDKENFSFSRFVSERLQSGGNASSHSTDSTTTTSTQTAKTSHEQSLSKVESVGSVHGPVSTERQPLADLREKRNTGKATGKEDHQGAHGDQSPMPELESKGEATFYNTTATSGGDQGSGRLHVQFKTEPRHNEAPKPPKLQHRLTYRGGQLTDAQELALYALLQTEFEGDRSKAFQLHDPGSPQTLSVVKALQLLFENEIVIASTAVASYIGHARSRRNNHQLGRIRGQWRWNYFQPEIQAVCDQCSCDLKTLLDLTSTEEAMAEAKKTVLLLLEQAVQTAITRQTDRKKAMTLDTLRENWPKIQPECSQWVILPPDSDDCLQLAYYRHGFKEPVFQFVLLGNMAWSVNAHAYQCDVSWANLPPQIDSLNCLKTVLHSLEDTSICCGCDLEKYKEEADKRGGVFHGHDKRVVVAAVDDQVNNQRPCIRSKCCAILLPAHPNSRNLCSSCKALDNSLRSLHSRSHTPKHGDGMSKHTPYVTMSWDELVQAARKGAQETHRLQEEVRRLRKAQEEMENLHHSDDEALSAMFRDLETGIQEIETRLQQPNCKWESCAYQCGTVEELHQHCLMEHAHNTGGSTPIDRQYACKWKHCKRSPFHKFQHLANHLWEHTGRPEDSYFRLLLADQAKALTTPDRQMRWHPSVIRWCLMQYRRSKSAYSEMREARYLRLPSARTLDSYSVFSQPSSGWQAETLVEMVRQYDEACKDGRYIADQGKLGGLFFDEVKIKEGLVFNQSTQKLIGFVDFDDGEGGEADVTQLLATNIMQFYYKSLFAPFSFPCAYFLTRSVTSVQINQMFWTGVHALHEHGFGVLMACADGASYNRTFFRMNADNTQPWRCDNPWTGEPIFFLSDPPHLLKKLRNQLFNSGDDQRHTRYMIARGKPLLWEHVEAVREADQASPLKTTPLTREHTDLDSVSKMKMKLAMDVFDTSIRTHMERHNVDATVETRQYLNKCSTILSVFNSAEPLRLPEDERITQLEEVKVWFTEWKRDVAVKFLDKSERQQRFIAWQTFEDLCLTINGLHKFLDYITSLQFLAKHGGGRFVIPKRLSQDIVESYFSLQRSSCGGNTNMTAATYGSNAQSLILSHVAKKNSRKRKHGEGLALRKRPRPVACNDLWPHDLDSD